MLEYIRFLGSPGFVVAAAALWVTGCEAAHDGCERVAACGGDLVGVWEVTSACSTGTLPESISTPSDCESGLQFTGAVANATLEFTRDGGYRQRGELEGEERVTQRAQCLPEAAGQPVTPATCEATSPAVPEFSCRVHNGGCECKRQTRRSLLETGRYETSGTRLEFDGRLSSVHGYCVKDDRAWLTGPTGEQFSLKRNDLLEPDPSLPLTPDPNASAQAGARATGTAGSGSDAVSRVPEPPASEPLDGVQLYRGTATPIDVFSGPAGVYVVLSDEIILMDREGGDITRLESPRPISAAAFDGETLVVADGAKLSSYAADLEPITSDNLVEACEAGVLISDQRFICGARGHSSDRTFYTYDARSGELLASSSSFTYAGGIAMRAVPGMDAFVKVSDDSSPSDFHLYLVSDSGEVTYAGESLYHGDFRVTPTYAWDRIPASHLITDTGLILTIIGSSCPSSIPNMVSDCFTKDGALGTLIETQAFVAMDTDARGRIHALMSPSGIECAKECRLQRIDVESRIVEAERLVRLRGSRVVALRHDVESKGVVVAYQVAPEPGVFSMDQDYRVALLEHE